MHLGHSRQTLYRFTSELRRFGESYALRINGVTRPDESPFGAVFLEV